MNQPQWNAPYPPQQQPQQPQFAPPGQFQPTMQPGQNLGQAAGQNLFNQFLTEPPRRRANRAKPADGSYIVRFTPGSKMEFSQKDGRPFLLLEYQVIEGSVPQMQGQVFQVPVFWGNRMQLQDLADLAKYVFGANLQAVAQQTQGNPQMMAQFICQAVSQGYFAGVRVIRSQKQIQMVGYENAFAQHNWIVIGQQPLTLAQLGPQMGPPQAPTQSWQQGSPGQPLMSSQPQTTQVAWQPPAPVQPAYVPSQTLPQLPQLPQAPSPQNQPSPAFYIPPGAQPPR